LKNGEQKTFTITGCSNAVNKKFSGEVNIIYRGETGLTHTKKGSLIDKVEAGRVIQPGSFEWITTTEAEFDEGGYSNTKSAPDEDESVQFDGQQSSGEYTSKVFDAGKSAA